MSDPTATDVVAYEDVTTDDAIKDALSQLASGNFGVDVWSTFTAGQGEDVLYAMQDSEPAKQNLNTELDVTGLLIVRVELLNEQTGEIQSQPRCIIVTADKAYHVTSAVVMRDIRNTIALRGAPSEQRPFKMKFEGGGSGTRQFVTLKSVRPAKAGK